MALVMLPSDLPWWDSVKKQLKKISKTKNTQELVESMQKIYEMCNVSLDPDEDISDPDQFIGLSNFLDNELTSEERSIFFSKILPSIANRALKIKDLKPKTGLHFSLQQQSDSTELDYPFLSSLLANAFFSTFPRRTHKTHPTLQNFNFSDFFKKLNSNSQHSKLRSVLHYFEWLENNTDALDGNLRISRQVMNSREWLTIEDWLECNLPLCKLKIKHDGSLDRTEENCVKVLFCSSKIGGQVLFSGNNQECLNLMSAPELLTTLLNVEALEDNEVLTVERVRYISRILDPKHKANLEKLQTPQTVTICCIDADDYTKLPIGQYEEDNILRELNKCLLGFQQKQFRNNEHQNLQQSYYAQRRRLSPIGESTGSVQSESMQIPLITQQSASTTRSDSVSSISENNNTTSANKLKVKLEIEKSLSKIGHVTNEALINNRRGRFIVLGSSGECLPVKRHPLKEDSSSYTSCESSEEEFHSAKNSLDDDLLNARCAPSRSLNLTKTGGCVVQPERNACFQRSNVAISSFRVPSTFFNGSEDENYHKRYSLDLETPERRHTFAQRLKDALRREVSSSLASSSEESSYAVGISVAGSGLEDGDIKVRRGGSTGFRLKEESLDENFLQNSLQQEKQWIDKFKNKQFALNKKDSHKSSEYSFSTDYSSELEEVYEQFSRWLESPLLETEKGTKRELDARELAVVRFAGSILKRTLSESFAGVPLPMTEVCDTTADSTQEYQTKKNRLVLNAKSLSLELARQKHRLAALLSAEQDNFEESLPPLTKSRALNPNNRKKTTAWFISCVNETIVQNLEDVSVNVCLPKNEQLSEISNKPKSGLKPISTGNWGCGSSRKGDVQLKVIIQWLAASVAGVPYMTYYTFRHQQLAKLDTVCRILVDRKWTVKDLAEATLRYSKNVLHGKELSGTLFEELISDRTM